MGSKSAMEEIAAQFERERGTKVRIIFGGAGTLLTQIELSGKGEVFLAGAPDYFVLGERRKVLIEGSEQVVAYLIPEIITPAGNPAGIYSLEDLARPEVKVAIGNPESIALGLYGIEILQENGLLEKVLKNVVTFAGNCSKLVNLAALRQVDAVIGWRVCHFWNPERLEGIPIDPERLPRISYISISVPVFTRDPNLSREFIDFVLSPAGKAVYRKYGYITSLEEAGKFAPRATIGGECVLPARYSELLEELSI